MTLEEYLDEMGCRAEVKMAILNIKPNKDIYRIIENADNTKSYQLVINGVIALEATRTLVKDLLERHLLRNIDLKTIDKPENNFDSVIALLRNSLGSTEDTIDYYNDVITSEELTKIIFSHNYKHE